MLNGVTMIFLKPKKLSNVGLFVLFAICMNFSAYAQKEIPDNIKGILLEAITVIDSAKVPQDVDKAIDLFKQARKLAPDNPEVHYYLGKTLTLIEGNARNAIKEYKKYLSLYPDAPDKENVAIEIGRLENTLKTKRSSSLMGVELMALQGGIYVRRVQELAAVRGQARMQRLFPGQKIEKINGEEVKESNLQEVLNAIDANSSEQIELTVSGSGEPYTVKVPKAGNKGLIKSLDEEDLHELITASAKVIVIWTSDQLKNKYAYLTKVNSFINSNKGVKAYQINLSKNKMLDEEFGIDNEALPAVSFYKDGKLVDTIKGDQPDVFDDKAKALTE
jgi:tetratricopeptide (TPR) repeat protein